MLVECVGCEDRSTFITGDVPTCPNCGTSLDAKFIELNKKVERLAKQMILLCELAKEETGRARQALINSAIETAEELNNLLK